MSAHQDLQDWYGNLHGRRVDLVGDYAGSELFIIEGDSLLQYCFAQPELDFEHGFQLLHAVHIVETLLHGFLRRKCVFSIAFCNDNKSCCIPITAPTGSEFKYKLARAAVVRHLQTHLPSSQPEVEVRIFDSVRSGTFENYLHESGAYFIMCHDGAISPNTYISRPRSEIEALQTALRSTIRAAVSYGYNVALLNGLEFRDTKIMTMVMEGSASRSDVPIISSSSIDMPVTNGLEELSILDAQPKTGDKSDHEGQLLTLEVLHQLLKTDQIGEQMATAIALHSAFLIHLPLASRRLPRQGQLSSSEIQELERFCLLAERIITKLQKGTQESRATELCNVADLIDGRLLCNVLYKIKGGSSISNLTEAVWSTFRKMQDMLGLAKSSESNDSAVLSDEADAAGNTQVEDLAKSVLPFSNPVFDAHLASVHLPIDAKVDKDGDTARIFQEVSHWHNARPLEPKTPKVSLDARQQGRALRRNQFFMKDMATYAASLTNAVGKMLEPEVVIVDKDGLAAKQALKTSTNGEKQNGPNPKASSKQAALKKTNQKGSRKEAMMQDLAVEQARKQKIIEDKYFSTWSYQLQELQRTTDLASRYEKAHSILLDLGSDKGPIVGSEIRLYLIDTLLRMWIQICKKGEDERSTNMNVAALMWNHLHILTAKSGVITGTIRQALTYATVSLGLRFPEVEVVDTDRKLSFTFALSKEDKTLKVTDSPKTFQLQHCGPFMDRSINSAVDPRTRFDPDGWQRDVLDTIDANKSLFVVAPTSAGKTFISFYAMKKTLLADNDGVIVYVAPTKALVNQIAAEIQANFSKTYKTGGKSVWAIHTRDYRINSPVGCQVLVTVPHILQIMLLSPSNAGSWSSRVKRIIFDEIHSIGQAEDGIVWEQLLLLAPCPIIALSATVGNPDEFSEWLSSTQRSLKNDLRVIIHPHRYSDLRKYVYNAPTDLTFHGLTTNPPFGELGLDKDVEHFPGMHPVSTLVHRSQGVPEDLSLEPRDCLELWKAFSKFASKNWRIDDSMNPARRFGDVIRKSDVIAWEADLKKVLKAWISDKNSPFDAVLKQLSLPQSQPKSVEKAAMSEEADEGNNVMKTTMSLLFLLQSRNALPAILFNYDRTMCEKIGAHVLKQLVEAEEEYKDNDAAWKRKLADWEKWKKVQAAKKAKKPVAPSKSKNRQEDGPMSKADSLRDNAESDLDPTTNFDPTLPLEPYSFANSRVLPASELDEHVWHLERKHIAPKLIDGIRRGIGIHHAGMNRAYRQVIEVLFRRGFLRVVIATGTLALGINMPCKTVVFSGDSVFLTALNFRQCAGRAGRRGFDLLGNVVFHGLPLEKARRLVSSRLPSLNGHFPITTSLVLRLFILLHESKEAVYARTAINSLLSQPRLYLGGQSFKDQVLHHLRFSIEYLRRSSLLNAHGVPLNFAGCVSHLYFTENSSFALHALMKGGYFHRLTANLTDENSEEKMRTLILVLAHLFGRRPCRQADLEPANYEKKIKGSPSIVFLPELPEDASRILRDHNHDTLDIFSTYVRTFAEQHMQGKTDNVLPFTGVVAGAKSSTETKIPFLPVQPPTTVRSHFVALSGHGDTFTTIPSLCRTARSGVFLEEAVIPYVPVTSSSSSKTDAPAPPLNAYLLDFYKHGDTLALAKANGIRKGEVWFLLNDFSLVLATIVAALKNLMNLGDPADPDLMDLQGGGDQSEELTFDQQLEAIEKTNVSIEAAKQAPSTAASLTSTTTSVKPKKKKVTESWDDDAGDDSSSNSDDTVGASTVEGLKSTSQAATGIGGNDERPFKHEERLGKVLMAFERLKTTFDAKFRAMWA